ncbi:aminopeptidase P [Nitzschia inconspicua]|uniref:Xaa-Pro dipeptidase n=1 Tax=Nitzschia inconspicua TaxID=303405 RepID=A0A9K3M2Z7_9STRA|nr:aminopeptidase P [Nitzschia inconspicua]
MDSPFLSLGTDTYHVPLQLFQENRQKLATRLVEGTQSDKHIVILQGGPSPLRFGTDHEPVFRQESYFWWLTGVKEPDCKVVLTIQLASNVTTTLFIPKLPASYATIMGKIKTRDEWKQGYQLEQVLFTDDLEGFLEEEIKSMFSESQKPVILLLRGQNTDSGTTYEDLIPKFESKVLNENVTLDTVTLFPILAECRVHKSSLELALLEHVTQISSFAHAYVMRNIRPGMHEYQCESLFKHYAYFNYGSRLVSYTSICGCGPNAAVLHYGHAGEPNSRLIRDDEHCLFDMGAEYQCYDSDITCSFPANGKFTDKCKAIYESVLNAQRAVYAMMKPGVSWVDCHEAAELEIVKGLYKIGIIKLPLTMKEQEKITGTNREDSLPDESTIATLKDLVQSYRLGAVFMPHGLGHFLGIDTHDVGGYLPGHPPRSPLPGLKSLRTARTLQSNMVLTVEPGCYFIDHLLDEALMESNILSQYLNAELLQEYRGYGGVRLEDVVTVTQVGIVNFTVCPRTVSEVEHVMAGGKWPPLTDEAPELYRKKLTGPIYPLPPPPSK